MGRCVHLRLGGIRACMQLIYNPQRKQNCKAHSQIFPIEALVTGKHAVNSQEQAGLPAASTPETGPGDLATCGSALQRSGQLSPGSGRRPGEPCSCISETLAPGSPLPPITHPPPLGGSHPTASPHTLVLTAQRQGVGPLAPKKLRTLVNVSTHTTYLILY